MQRGVMPLGKGSIWLGVAALTICLVLSAEASHSPNGADWVHVFPDEDFFTYTKSCYRAPQEANQSASYAQYEATLIAYLATAPESSNRTIGSTRIVERWNGEGSCRTAAWQEFRGSFTASNSEGPGNYIYGYRLIGTGYASYGTGPTGTYYSYYAEIYAIEVAERPTPSTTTSSSIASSSTASSSASLAPTTSASTSVAPSPTPTPTPSPTPSTSNQPPPTSSSAEPLPSIQTSTEAPAIAASAPAAGNQGPSVALVPSLGFMAAVFVLVGLVRLFPPTRPA